MNRIGLFDAGASLVDEAGKETSFKAMFGKNGLALDKKIFRESLDDLGQEALEIKKNYPLL
ncbi:MAG: hypothetical protein LBD75_06720 [Candidatus Peribacteria bacterium]|nr:hypothetical protein [Candidatus Peribacteria bacterium]